MTRWVWSFSILVLTAAFASVSACGSGSPKLVIDFPPKDSWADTSLTPALTVRGRATGEMAAVKVGDVIADTDDGFATWQAEVSLQHGKNVIRVIATDKLGKQTEQTVVVNNVAYLPRGPVAPVPDESGEGFVSIDVARAALFHFDLDGNTEMLADYSVSPGMIRPQDMLRLESGDLIVVDAASASEPERSAIYRIPPADGEVRLISGRGAGHGPEVRFSYRIARHADPEKVLVADLTGGVFELNVMTGERRLLSHADPDGDPETNDAIGSGPGMRPRDVEFDAARNRYLVLSNRTVLVVDPLTGDRAVLADLPDFGDTLLLAPDGQLLVLSSTQSGGSVWVVDSNNGEVNLLSGNRPSGETRGAGPTIRSAHSLFTRADGALLLSTSTGIMEIDAVTGDRHLTPFRGLADQPAFTLPYTMVFDELNDRLIVGDSPYQPLRIVALDMKSGGQTLISEDGGRGQGVTETGVSRLALSSDGSTLWAIADGAALLVIDVASGDRRIVSSSEVGSGPPAGTFIHGLGVNEINNLAFVNAQMLALSRLFSIDLSDGHRELVSSQDRGAGPEFGSLRDVAIHPDGESVLVMETANLIDAPQRVLRVDPVSGDREVLMDIPEYPYSLITTVDGVFLYGDAGIQRVDVETGVLDVVSGAARGRGFPSGRERWLGNQLAYDSTRKVFYAGMNYPASIIAVDALSGDRVVIAY